MKVEQKNKTVRPDADTKDRWTSLMRNLLEGIVGIFVGFLSALPDFVVCDPHAARLHPLAAGFESSHSSSQPSQQSE